MKTKMLLIILLNTFIFFKSQSQSTSTFSHYKKVQRIMDKSIKQGLSGVVVFIKHPKKGVWIGTSGHSNREDKTRLKEQDIFALASVSKTYTATAIMLLVEEGKLNLEDPISKYLPQNIIENITNARLVTVKQLLNMTSGFYNYDRDEILNQKYLSGNLKLDTASHLNILKEYVYKKRAVTQPGTAFKYSSTNYMLLAMIMDNILGYYHGKYIKEKIFKPLELLNTYYRETPQSNHVQTYGDLNEDGILENITNMTIETTNWFIGDDGVYADIKDVAYFMEALLKGKIVNTNSLTEMKKWVTPEKKDYGLGLSYDKSFPYNELIGHSGRGIGTTTDVYYFPKQDMTVAILSNTGKRNGDRKFSKAYNKLISKMIFKLFIF